MIHRTKLIRTTDAGHVSFLQISLLITQARTSEFRPCSMNTSDASSEGKTSPHEISSVKSHWQDCIDRASSTPRPPPRYEQRLKNVQSAWATIACAACSIAVAGTVNWCCWPAYCPTTKYLRKC